MKFLKHRYIGTIFMLNELYEYKCNYETHSTKFGFKKDMNIKKS